MKTKCLSFFSVLKKIVSIIFFHYILWRLGVTKRKKQKKVGDRQFKGIKSSGIKEKIRNTERQMN